MPQMIDPSGQLMPLHQHKPQQPIGITLTPQQQLFFARHNINPSQAVYGVSQYSTAEPDLKKMHPLQQHQLLLAQQNSQRLQQRPHVMTDKAREAFEMQRAKQLEHLQKNKAELKALYEGKG